MKNQISIFWLHVVVTTAIVGIVALGAWFLHFSIEQLLSSPYTFGNIEIIPYGHKKKSILEHSYDSIMVNIDKNTIMVRKPHLDITPFGEEKIVKLDVAELYAQIHLDTNDTAETKPYEPIGLPDDLSIPIPVSIAIDKIALKISDDSVLTAQKLLAKSEGDYQVEISIKDIQNKILPSPAALSLKADFKKRPRISGYIKTTNDFVHIDYIASRKDLAKAQINAKVNVKDYTTWIADKKILEDIPVIKEISVNADIQTDIASNSINYKTTLNTEMEEYWPLTPLALSVTLNGNLDSAYTDLLFTNDEGGSISLSGDIDKDFNCNMKGEVSGMSAEYGPQMMPMDLKISSFQKTGDKIEASIETHSGSIINASMDLENDLSIIFSASVSPLEPWALDWCKGDVELSKPVKVFGTFDNGKMKAHVNIDSVPFAYHMKADSLRVNLVLDRYSIVFPKITIYTPDETFDAKGDVYWDFDHPRTYWKISQRHGGNVELYVDVFDSIKVDAKAEKAEISTIPFARIKMNDNMKGHISGTWKHNFESYVGEAELEAEGEVQSFNLQGYIKVHEIGDTVLIDRAMAVHNGNAVDLKAAFVMPNDTVPNFKPTAMLPVKMLYAWSSAKDFSLPLVLEPLGDTTLATGMMNGEMTYKDKDGLHGKFEFSDLNFSTIPSQLFNIRKMSASANRDSVDIQASLDILQGSLTGNTQVSLTNILSSAREVLVTHNSDNGGHLSVKGNVDNDFLFTGKMVANGTWLVPGTRYEITKTDLNVDVNAKLREGLKGIDAKISSDSTMLLLPQLEAPLPFMFSGNVDNGRLNIAKVFTQNKNGEKISGSLKYDLSDMKLEAIDIHSDKYTLKTGSHTVSIEKVKSHLEETDKDISLSADIPSIKYAFHDESLGDAQAIAHADLTLLIPHTQKGLIKNKTVSGNVIVDKLVYHKDLDIEITPSSLDKLLNLFNSAISKLRSKEQTEAKISVSSPIDLDIHVTESQTDSVEIVTPFATFPLTFDIQVRGNTNRPLLRGDVTNSNNGFIGVRDLYQFELNTFNISWMDVPWQHGTIDVSSSQELPYCTESEDKDKEDETCPINLSIMGTITNPQINPTSNCGTESSAAALYYNIFLGCIANETGEATDWNKLAGKAIGKVLASTANKTLGGDYIGDIDMKVKLFNNNSNSEKDSTYFKIPISLDRWVKNLSLIFGYTQDQSENPTYDQALQFGATYTLPVFKEKEYSHKNHISPTLSLNGLLISKQYLSNTGTEGNENRIEKNIGLNYTYRFWNPCLLGIGHCETVRPTPKMNQENKKK